MSLETRSPAVARSDLWFSDGNIVLIASSAAFKVHMGQLSRHSEVFEGLFTVPTPGTDALFDGCSYVELYDRPDDVYNFLLALYDGLYFKSHKADDFGRIAGVLRLSTKYMVEHLRRHCLARLELDWPSSLRAWDRRERVAVDSMERYSPRECYAHPSLVLSLGLELDLPSILPAAFYDLSRYGPSKIAEAVPETPPTPVNSSDNTAEEPEKREIQLSHELLGNIFLGREKGQKYIARFIATEVCRRQPSATCSNASDRDSVCCHESFYFIMLNVLRSVGGIASGRDGDPLFTLVQAMEMLSRTDFTDGVVKMGLKLCHDCKIDFAISASKAREEVWKRIPGWFGLAEEIADESLAVDVDEEAGDSARRSATA